MLDGYVEEDYIEEGWKQTLSNLVLGAGLTLGGLGALTVKQAFKGFTLDAAYSGHMEDSLGTLTPGKWADFILVDQDIFTIDAKDIWKTEVHATYVAGEQVFSKQAPKQ